MKIKPDVKALIDQLIAIHLNKGVQPSDISGNIFEDNYRTVEIMRCSGSVKMTVSFCEFEDSADQSIVHMRYTYSPDKTLMQIEQKVGRKPFKIQWDRRQSIKDLICKIAQELKQINDPTEVDTAMRTIPNEFVVDIGEKLKLVA